MSFWINLGGAYSTPHWTRPLSLFIYFINLCFAQDFFWKMTNNFSLVTESMPETHPKSTPSPKSTTNPNFNPYPNLNPIPTP